MAYLIMWFIGFLNQSVGASSFQNVTVSGFHWENYWVQYQPSFSGWTSALFQAKKKNDWIVAGLDDQKQEKVVVQPVGIYIAHKNKLPWFVLRITRDGISYIMYGFFQKELFFIQTEKKVMKRLLKSEEDLEKKLEDFLQEKISIPVLEEDPLIMVTKNKKKWIFKNIATKQTCAVLSFVEKKCDFLINKNKPFFMPDLVLLIIAGVIHHKNGQYADRHFLKDFFCFRNCLIATMGLGFFLYAADSLSSLPLVEKKSDLTKGKKLPSPLFFTEKTGCPQQTPKNNDIKEGNIPSPDRSKKDHK